MRYKVVPYNTTEYASAASFPVSGESGRYFLALNTMTLYSWNGTAYVQESFRYEGKPTYHGTYLKSGYLEFSSVFSPTPIEWHTGDYIRYERTERTYRLYSVPQAERHAGTGTTGESFSYRNVQLYDDFKAVELAPFRNLVKGANNQYYFSSQQDTQTYENVQGIAARIERCLNEFAGDGAWQVIVCEYVPSSFHADEPRDYSASGSCMDALTAIHNTWEGLGWTYLIDNGQNTISIGYPNADPSYTGNQTYPLWYRNGLTSLKHSSASQDGFCTRMYVYGTDRNMIDRYYNGKDIHAAASVYIPNLMIPLEHWGTTGDKPDASKAYIEDADKVALYGLVSKNIYFDGTDGNPEVFPSIEGATIGAVKEAKDSMQSDEYYPQEQDDTLRVDEVASVIAMPSDEGVDASSGERYVETHTENLYGTIETYNTPDRYVVNAILFHQILTHSGDAEFKMGGVVELRTQLAVSDCYVGLTVSKDSPSHGNILYKQSGEKVSSSPLGGTFSFSDFTLRGMASGDDIYVSLSYSIRTATSTVVTLSGYKNTSVFMGLRQVLTKNFSIRLRQIGFDINKMQKTDGATLSMKDGMCAGREFPITKAVYIYDDDEWELTCTRVKDDSTSCLYPYGDFPIEAGDRFVILGIVMPEEYVLIQSERLYDLGTELYDKVSSLSPVYEPGIDSKKICELIEAHPYDESYRLIEGKYMRIYDEDMIPDGTGTARAIIGSLTIEENDSAIPVYRVTLADRLTPSPGGLMRSVGNMSSEIRQMQVEQRSQARQMEQEETSRLADTGNETLPVFSRGGGLQPVTGIDVPDFVVGQKGVAAGGIGTSAEGGGGGGGDVTVVPYDDVDAETAEDPGRAASAYSMKKIKGYLDVESFPVFSSAHQYLRGDECLYMGLPFRFITSHQGEWRLADVEQVTMKSLLNPTTILATTIANLQ